MILLHIGNSIQQTARPKYVSVFSIKRLGNNARLVFPRFEMRIGETDEDLGELMFGEEIGEEFHCVRPMRGDILVTSCDGDI